MPFFTSFSGKILSGPGLKLGPKRIIVTLSSNQANYSFTPTQVPGYETGAEITLVIDPGVYVYSTSTSTAGLSISNFSGDDVVNIVNNGYIMGQGGNGGAGTGQYTANPGTAGGPAINLNYPVSITNNSYIGGGGGGGGGAYGTYSVSAAAGGGGGAGGGSGGNSRYISSGATYSGGAGGNPGASGSDGGSYAGGGGGRIMPGNATTAYRQGGQAGGSGARAINNGNGSYGLGGGGGNAGGSAVNDGNLPRNSGGGGGWGASGGTGYFNYAGGAGGKAVNLNGNTVTWLATGTRYGAIS